VYWVEGRSRSLPRRLEGEFRGFAQQDLPPTASSDGLRRREFRKDWLSSFPFLSSLSICLTSFSYHREISYILLIS
jgi:hypothetical protein